MMNPMQISPETAMQMAAMQQAQQMQGQQGIQGAMPQQSPWAAMGQDPNVGPMLATNGSPPPMAKASPAPTSGGLWDMVKDLVQNEDQKKIEKNLKTKSKVQQPVASKTGAGYSKGFNSASGTGNYSTFAPPKK